jgi:hypothetical protein
MNYCDCKNVDLKKEAIRLGRAHYICPRCKCDVTIFLTLLYEMEEKEKERRLKNVRSKKHKSKSVK